MIGITRGRTRTTETAMTKIKTFYGGAVKITSMDADTMTVSGPGVVFSKNVGEKPVRDFHGEYFTNRTWFGHTKGDGSVGLFEHGRPFLYPSFNEDQGHPKELYDFFGSLAKHRFENPVKTEMYSDGEIEGLAASVVLNMRNKYEKWIGKQAQKGLLGWSSGSAPHVINITREGEIKAWPIVEFSLTPTPADNRTFAEVKSSFLVNSGILAQFQEPNVESVQKNLANKGTNDYINSVSQEDLYYLELINAQQQKSLSILSS